MNNKVFTIAMGISLILTVITSIIVQANAVTWSVNTKRLTFYTFRDGYPTLTQTKDGRVWLVWSKEIQGNLTLYYKITSDQGKTWSEEMNLTAPLTAGQNQNPSIMQAKNETVWVVWTSDRPPPPPPPTPDFYMEASPQNLTTPQGESNSSTITVTSIYNFSETVSLTVLNEPAGVTATLDPIQVTPPANGTVNSNLTVSADFITTPGDYTLTVLGKGDHLMHILDVYLKITVFGGSSQANMPIHTHAPSSTLASSSGGDYEIYCKTSNDKGATWSEDIQLTSNSVDDLRPAIIQLTNGTIMIIWQTYTSDNHDIVYRTTTDGISWSETTQLTTDSNNDKAPAVTQTKDGKIWVAWASNRTGDWEIFYKIYDGFSWSVDTRLTYSTNSDVQPAILQAIDETILVFWASGTPTGSFDIYYKYSTNYGATWSESTEFAASNYEDTWPAVTRAEDTKIWITWMSDEADQPDGNWEIYCRTSLAGDVNEDSQVNVMDLTMVSMAYGCMEGEPNYNADADINKDGIVDMRDIRIVAYYLGVT